MSGLDSGFPHILRSPRRVPLIAERDGATVASIWLLLKTIGVNENDGSDPRRVALQVYISYISSRGMAPME